MEFLTVLQWKRVPLAHRLLVNHDHSSCEYVLWTIDAFALPYSFVRGFNYLFTRKIQLSLRIQIATYVRQLAYWKLLLDTKSSTNLVLSYWTLDIL